MSEEVDILYNKIKGYEYSSIILDFFHKTKYTIEDLYKIINKEFIKPTIKELIKQELIVDNGFMKTTILGLKIYDKLKQDL